MTDLEVIAEPTSTISEFVYEQTCSKSLEAYTNSEIVDVGSAITSKSVILSVCMCFFNFFYQDFFVLFGTESTIGGNLAYQQYVDTSVHTTHDSLIISNFQSSLY